MLAKIRVVKNGNSLPLPKAVDLLRFSQEDIRSRLVDMGYPYDSELLVVGFEDWEVERTMTLNEAYLLKVTFEKYYDCDEAVIVYLLRSNRTVRDAIYDHYRLLATNELDTAKKLFENLSKEELIEKMFGCGTWINLLQGYLDSHELLICNQKFYILHE